MPSDWGFGWDAEAARRADDAPNSATMAASLPSKQGRHRRSNSTPLENTSSQLLTATSDSKAEEQEDAVDGSSANFLQDVLNGSTLTKARSERTKGRGGGRGTRRGALQSAARQNTALAQRVSGRMTKGRSKLTVLHEGYSTDEEADSGEDGYQHVMGKGGKVRRVLANRQSAQRSRIRKLQHISELEVTLEALQDDLFKLNPQLSKLEAKQAGLDEENKELQQKLAALKVESRQKEAVNQALAQEVAECRHKQQNEQRGHNQQQQQQQQQRHRLDYAAPQMHAQFPSYQSAQGCSYQQQPCGSPQPSYPQHVPQMYRHMHSQAPGQSQQQPTATQADTDYDHDFVEQLMQRYQYDQAQERHREQQAAHDSHLSRQQQQQQQQQNFQQSHHQYDQQQQQQQQPGGSAQDRAHQQSQRALDMLSELKQVASSSHVRPGYQHSDQARAHGRWGDPQQEYQQQPAGHFAHQGVRPQVSWQGSHDSVEDRGSPHLIYSGSFPTQEMPYQQQQEGTGFQPGPGSLDGDHSHWASHHCSSEQQQSPDGAHAAAQPQDRPHGFNRPTSHLQRRSVDGSHLEAQQQRQVTDQHQLLYRSQSLTHPPQQTGLQRQSMQESRQQQQQSIYPRPQTAGCELSGAPDTVRHLQKHSTGQMQLEASSFVPRQSQSQSQSGPQHQLHCSQAPWPQALSQPQYALQSQGQNQPQAQNSPWEADERQPHAALPKKKSSGDMSRHGSGSTDGPLSEYVPAECILRSFDSTSNASSEQSEWSLGATQRAALGGFLRAEGQSALPLHGPAEAVRHAAWAKGMPPSGKKKKDSSQHRAAVSRLT